MIEYDIYFIQVLTRTETSLCRTERQDVPYDRAAPHGRPLQLPLFLHKRHFFSHSRFNFALSGPAFLYKPLPELVEQPEGATSSPPTTSAGRKQLIPCSMSDFEATVDSKQFTNSSRKRRASRRNSVRKSFLPILSSADITRVPERKSFSSTAENRK